MFVRGGGEDDPRIGNRTPRIPQNPSTQPVDDPNQVPNHEIHGGPVDPHRPPPHQPGQAPGNNDVDVLPPDAIGDIPPPPIPLPPISSGPSPITPSGVPGSLAQPGSRAAMPFRSNAFTAPHPRFGPGAPMAGGGSTQVSGLGGDAAGLGLSPDDAAEILRLLAAGHSGGGGMPQ